MTRPRPDQGARPSGELRDKHKASVRAEYLEQIAGYLAEGLGWSIPDRWLPALRQMVADAIENRAIARYRRRRP